jgi:hypothetical protein
MKNPPAGDGVVMKLSARKLQGETLRDAATGNETCNSGAQSNDFTAIPSGDK